MPARKPRTECCCHPVAFAIATIVAPFVDRNIEMRRDCFDLVSIVLVEDARLDRIWTFVACTRSDAEPGLWLFVSFDTENPFGSWWRYAPLPKPHLGQQPAGQDSGRHQCARTSNSTAPFAEESQSFLGNLAARRDAASVDEICHSPVRIQAPQPTSLKFREFLSIRQKCAPQARFCASPWSLQSEFENFCCGNFRKSLEVFTEIPIFVETRSRDRRIKPLRG